MPKKSGLGRGLESLLGETAGEVHPDGEGVTEVPLSQISVNPDQPRKVFDQDDLDELTESIRRNGVLQPVLVRPYEGQYQLVAGERRYQAATAAGLDTIPAVIKEIDDAMVLELALIENLQRSDLNPMEEAFGYRTLMAQNGLSQSQLAEVLSKSRPAIANALRLTTLPEEVQEMVSSGTLTAGHARAILAVEDDEQRIALAHKVAAGRLSVRQTEKLASTFSVKRKRAHKQGDEGTHQYDEVATRLSSTLATGVRIKRSRGKGRIEIDFTDDDQLACFVSLLCNGGMQEGKNTQA